MTITQCEYIVAVDTYKNFSTAAEKCFVTQPTLSMQIQKLEDELDVILFDRKNKPILTTPLGEKIIDQARIIISEHRKIKDIIKQYKGEISGNLTVGILPTIAPYLLPCFLKGFMSRYPLLRLQVEELTTDEIIDRLKKDTLDIGILATPLEVAGITEIPLYSEKMLVYVSSDHPFMEKDSLSTEEIDAGDVWLLNRGHCFRNQVLNLCSQLKNDEEKSLNLESGSIETIMRIVEANGGITIIPEMAALGLSGSVKKQIKAFKGQDPGRQISIVTRRTFLKNHTIDALKKEILASIPRQILENRPELVDIH